MRKSGGPAVNVSPFLHFNVSSFLHFATFSSTSFQLLEVAFVSFWVGGWEMSEET